MCEYIKDDGEQCGMDDQPFCRHHEDTRFAKLWRRLDDVAGQIVPESSLSGDSGGSNSIRMETHCDECEAALRRTERLSQHPNSPRQIVFEAVVECDCGEVVLGQQPMRERATPDGWST